jgi:hypothetical protein
MSLKYDDLTEQQKKKLAEADRKHQLELAKTDPSYAKAHPELTLDAKTDLNDPEQRKVVEKLIEAKDKAEAHNGEPTREELETENSELKDRLAILAEQALQKKKKALGLDPNDPVTIEQLQGYEKALQAKEKNPPSGSAPLNSAQLGQQSQEGVDLRLKKFESYDDMVRFLHSPSDTSEEAQEKEQALKDLWAHGLKQWRAMSNRPEMSVNPNEQVPQTGVKEPEIVSDMYEGTGESELAKFGIKKDRAKNKRPFGQAQPRSPNVKVEDKKESD